MTSTVLDRQPDADRESERLGLVDLERRLTSVQGSAAKLIGPDGEHIELPETAFRVLQQVVHHLARGEIITLVPYHKELTTQQAADLLNVSRPYLIRLLEQGEIPYTKTGTHRRVRFEDLMTYKEQRDARRRDGLARLTELSQELGLYDEDPKEGVGTGE